MKPIPINPLPWRRATVCYYAPRTAHHEPPYRLIRACHDYLAATVHAFILIGHIPNARFLQRL